ncbi:hypothetical protein [Okeania sp. KiyG1]|nr:hypothetical protein [Okeania sp. KiyG1]
MICWCSYHLNQLTSYQHFSTLKAWVGPPDFEQVAPVFKAVDRLL